jgi:hypothetical protein
MDHRLIEEQGLAESYVMGRLTPEEEERFEEHLLECRECREQVAWAEDLRGSFRELAAEEQTRAAAAIHLGLFASLARRGRAVQWGLAALLAVLAVGLPAWLLVQQGNLRRELAEARRAAPVQPAPPVPPPSSGADPALATERERLREELQAERRQREELAGRLAQLTRPQVNTAIFSLGFVRGEEETNQVALSAEPAWIVLAVEPPEPDVETWRATLRDASGRTLWKGEGLHPAADGSLVLSLRSDLLEPGDWRLALAGKPPGGQTVSRELSFHVTRQGEKSKSE